MRERFARWATGITAALVVVLVIVFASLQNPPQDARPETRDAETPDTALDTALDTARVEAGRQLYNAQECSMCHSIAGTGNPRNPLDRVGARHDADAMRDWIVATGVAADALPTNARHVKADYRDLPDDYLDALVAYMRSLR
jgi:mono/diheme cytochrome c family protein